MDKGIRTVLRLQGWRGLHSERVVARALLAGHTVRINERLHSAFIEGDYEG